MLLNSSVCIFFLITLLLYEHLNIFVTSLNHNLKDKVHVLEEDVLEPQYRETDKLLSLRNYALEDFFWTGSGDGPPPPDPIDTWPPSSVATTTLLATIFIESPQGNGRPPSSEEEEDCVSECPITPHDGSPISPTRPGHDRPSLPPPDQRYWLLTVLQAPAVPLPPNLDVRLARLYRTAFLRQQEEHLGIITTELTGARNKNNFKTRTKISLKNSTNEKNISRNRSEFDIQQHTTSAVEEFKFLRIDEPSSTNNSVHSSISPEAPFEYITNYFEVTPINVIKRLTKRSVLQNQKKEVNVSNATIGQNSTLDIAKRQTPIDNQPEVEVFLYNVTTDSGGKQELKVIYWVSVGGHPVPAQTAARDMRLLADSEVVAELGYPVTTKAEPYLKSPEPLNGVSRATNIQDTWLIVGATVLAIIFLLVMVAFLVCRLAYRRKSSGNSRTVKARPSIDSKGVQYPSEGKDNMAYMQEDGKLISIISPSKQKLHKSEADGVSPTRRYVRGPQYKVNRVGSADSSTSSSSSTDLSQMNATLRQRQKLFEHQIHNEYATINKKSKSKHRKIRSKKVGVVNTPRGGSPVEIKGDGTLQRFLVSDPPSPAASSSDASTFGEVLIRRPTGPVSPTSYLSMPSVKSFPRGNVVEPLSRVLEPLSVRHLDMDSPVHQYGSIKQPLNEESTPKKSNVRESKDLPIQRSVTPKHSPHLIRLGSLDKDPGIIGPMVWDLHNQRLKDSKANHGDGGTGANMSRMRQRFTELVDDAFSLFGSGYNTPKSMNNGTNPLDGPHGGATKQPIRQGSVSYGIHEGLEQRPLTALPPRPPLPKQEVAWESSSIVPVFRSTSAGGIQRRPVVDTGRVNSEGVLTTADPALPLLQAIRSELNKLPGTSDA